MNGSGRAGGRGLPQEGLLSGPLQAPHRADGIADRLITAIAVGSTSPEPGYRPSGSSRTRWGREG